MYLDPHTNRFIGQRVSFGGMGDSFYEYLLKTWVAGGKTRAVRRYRQLWDDAMDSMLAVLLQKSKPGGMAYVAELSDSGRLVHKMDHLACFVPGMLVLGAEGPRRETYLSAARALADTCVAMYTRTATGLAPEIVHFVQGSDFTVQDRSAHNLQRPETVESLFLLYRATGEPAYREQGWAIFEAFERHTRVAGGYTGLKDVRRVPPVGDDTQQSFWLAETLKYLYLLFSDSDTLPLDEWVLNTEAHPLPIRTRNTSLLAEMDGGVVGWLGGRRAGAGAGKAREGGSAHSRRLQAPEGAGGAAGQTGDVVVTEGLVGRGARSRGAATVQAAVARGQGGNAG